LADVADRGLLDEHHGGALAAELLGAADTDTVHKLVVMLAGCIYAAEHDR
jgi:hypothetical protein